MKYEVILMRNWGKFLLRNIFKREAGYDRYFK
jgi:hypothetical protein